MEIYESLIAAIGSPIHHITAIILKVVYLYKEIMTKSLRLLIDLKYSLSSQFKLLKFPVMIIPADINQLNSNQILISNPGYISDIE